jgi:hypothetical protein
MLEPYARGVADFARWLGRVKAQFEAMSSDAMLSADQVKYYCSDEHLKAGYGWVKALKLTSVLDQYGRIARVRDVPLKVHEIKALFSDLSQRLTDWDRS